MALVSPACRLHQGFLLQTALTRDEDKLSSLSDIYDPERRMDSYTHLNVLKRAQTAPDGRNLHEMEVPQPLVIFSRVKVPPRAGV